MFMGESIAIVQVFHTLPTVYKTLEILQEW